MNANELATALFHYWNETERFAISETLLNDCADMLRQQQAEIEALHKEREGICVFCENRAILKKAQGK